MVPGTKSLAQLRDNTAAAGAILPEETLAAIRKLGDPQTDGWLPW